MAMDKTKHALQKNACMVGAMIFLFFITSWPNIQAELAEQRWFRDIRGLTPFSEVVTGWSVVTDDGLLVGGSMKKDRCTFVQGSQVGYVRIEGKPKQSVFVDLTPEDILTGVVGQSRPPSNDPEAWGPWLIRWVGAPPLDWEIFVRHKDCPTPPRNQTNLFASGAWANLNAITSEK